jgi:hypothetical protein
MPERMILFAPATLSLLAALAAVLLTTPTTLAADDCVTRPGSSGPQGTHWYYRYDRVNGRQCWYLAAAGAKVASTVPHSSPVSELRLPSPRPSFMSAGADSFASVAPLSPVGERPAGGFGDAAASFAQRWPRSAVSPSAVERTRVALADGTATNLGALFPIPGANVDESAAGDGPDGLPLVWPVLTADERAAARAPYRFMTTLDRLLAIIAGAFALAAMAGLVLLKRPAAKTDRAQLAAATSAPGRRVRPAGPGEGRQYVRNPAELRVGAPVRRPLLRG